MVRLTIYDNNLEGQLSAAICRLERLHTLHLSFNKISGALPDELGACRALKNLWLKGNKLTGAFPDSIAVLPELEYLDVHANGLDGALPKVWNTPKLTIFRAEDNRIAGALPEQLLSQPKLEQVFLHNNRLAGPLPLTPSATLTALLLANNVLTGPIPEALGKLEKLTDLRLNRNKLSGAIPASLASAPALQVLRLDHNLLSGPVPPGLGERLTVFDISHNPDLELRTIEATRKGARPALKAAPARATACSLRVEGNTERSPHPRYGAVGADQKIGADAACCGRLPRCRTDAASSVRRTTPRAPICIP